MKIEIFEIKSRDDKVYLELLEQYKNNPEVHELMQVTIIPEALIMMGDFRLIKMLSHAIDMEDIKVYLLKDVDNNTFIWVVGKFLDDDKVTMYPLLKKQSKKLQLEVKKVLIEKGLVEEFKK